MRKTAHAKAALQNLLLLNTIMLKILQKLERVLSASEKMNDEWEGMP